MGLDRRLVANGTFAPLADDVEAETKAYIKSNAAPPDIGDMIAGSAVAAEWRRRRAGQGLAPGLLGKGSPGVVQPKATGVDTDPLGLNTAGGTGKRTLLGL